MKALTDVRWWILSGLAAAFIVGDTGHAPMIAMVTLMILMIVSLQGLTFRRSDITEKKKELLIGVLICYAVAGGVTLLVGSFYDHEIWVGFAMIAAVPCAISVTTGTLILKGDTKLAMITTAVIYIIALAVTPLMTHVFIGEAVSPFEVLKYVALFIAIPFIVSIPLKKVVIDADTKSISINIIFFILMFITFGANKDFILSEPETVLWVAAGCLVRIAAVAAAMEVILKWMRMRRDARIPMVLLSIWKNSALALSLTMILIEAKESVMPSALSLPLEMIWYIGMIWYFQKRCPPAEDQRPRTDAAS
jgi:BASS family bile acid:Na+ symporter